MPRISPLSTKQLPRKTVSFASIPPKIIRISAIKFWNWSNHVDSNDLWYSAEEYNNILSDCLRTVKKVEQQEPLSKNRCFRGLERLTAYGRYRTEETKCRARAIVFQEQASQRSQGIEDSNRMADLYSKLSVSCHSNAHMLGLADRQDVFLMTWKETGVPKEVLMLNVKPGRHP